MHSKHVILDLFAGTGVSVAAQRLGARDMGVEKMPEAVATREANGMETVYNDVWDAHLAESLEFDTLWASPPCQAFSMAGGGAGRKALDDVLAVISRKQYVDMTELREQAALLGDERIGLVLSPLHYAHRFRPTYLAFEQVPPVLPVWVAMATELRELGYSVWTGLLHAEQFGVPQTRKRAILMARRDGVEATPPVPTHSKYYSRDKKRLDPGVKKWVTMAEALGRSGTLRSNYGTGGDPAARGERHGDQPAATITSKADRNKWGDGRALSVEEAGTLQSYPSGVYIHPMTNGRRAIWSADDPAPTIRGVNRSMPPGYRGHYRDACLPAEAHPRLQVDEAATLQTYPHFVWKGAKTKQFLQIGNACPPLLTQRILEALWATPPLSGCVYAEGLGVAA